MLDRIGYINSPFLKDISKISFETYNLYISLLLINSKKFAELFLSEYQIDETAELYNLIILVKEIRDIYSDIFSFFLKSNVVFNNENNIFINLDDDNNVIGMINQSNFKLLTSVILQTNYIGEKNKEITGKVKSKRVQDLLDKISQEKAKISATKKSDVNLSLPNVISALCTKHNSINMLNIWGLTVYQVYDQFYRQNNLNIISTRERNYSVWGGEFDFTEWYKQLN